MVNNLNSNESSKAKFIEEREKVEFIRRNFAEAKETVGLLAEMLTETEKAERNNMDYRHKNYWQAVSVMAYVKDLKQVHIYDIFAHLNVNPSEICRKDIGEVSQLLRENGWVNETVEENGKPKPVIGSFVRS